MLESVLSTSRSNTSRLYLVFAVAMLSACAGTVTSPTEVTRDRAIEIARQHVSLEPTSVEATMESRQGKQVWVVTFHRADGSHGGLGQFAEVTVDRSTGEVVTIAIS